MKLLKYIVCFVLKGFSLALAPAMILAILYGFMWYMGGFE